MRRRIVRLTAWAAACALCMFSFQGISVGESTADTDAWNDFLSDQMKEKTKPAENEMPPQLTMEDIQEMNGDNIVVDLWNNRGYLSMLVGKFYEGKINDMEDGIRAVLGLANLLGFEKGCEFFAVYKSKSNKGYTFYTYKQRYGGVTLRNATLKVAVDPDGYTAGLSCSFIPGAGTLPQDPVISAEKAEKIVRREQAGLNLRYYSDRTTLMAVPFDDYVANCWVVYTDNPNATASFDMPYLEHFVTIYGEYMSSMPANRLSGDRDEVLDQSAYFDIMTTETYRTELTLEDGTKRTVEVPVSYNKNDGKYYLMDPSRKIAVAQFYDFNYKDYALNFVTSDTVDGWSQNNLLAYANYIIMYDFYADHGLRSIDAFGTPILVTVGWCDENHVPVDNACFYGVNNGWACFGVSDINHMSDCVDFVGHEYTHGITSQFMQGSLYENATGAINEAYSDIMGNLAEMSLGYTEDTTWLIGEKTGTPYRSMSNPNEYGQPAFVGDQYYKAAVAAPDFGMNDYGGVHDNNSLLGHIAWQMDQSGMDREDQITMWFLAAEMLTPLSCYEDVHGALAFALKTNDLKDYGFELNAAYEAAGLNKNPDRSYLTAEKEGCGRVTVRMDQALAELPTVVRFLKPDGTYVDKASADSDGVASALLPAGNYVVQTVVQKVDGKRIFLNYTKNGWKEKGMYRYITVKDGIVSELPADGLESLLK